MKENEQMKLAGEEIGDKGGKSNILSGKLKLNVTNYLFDFFYMRELIEICSTNKFLHNCFKEYSKYNWGSEISKIKSIFNLDIKDQKKELDESFFSCIQKARLYPMKDHPCNYIRIDKEGINIISLANNESHMELDLYKIKKNNSNKINPENSFDLEEFDMMELDENDGGKKSFGPWKAVYSGNSYVPGHILFLEEKSAIDFSFSFHRVVKGNYKFYLHQFIINMKNANLRIQITINNDIVLEIKNFPSNKILSQFEHENLYVNNDINLKESFICDINEYMFDSGEKEIKSSLNSMASTESSSSMDSEDNKSSLNIRTYTVGVRIFNEHLFWKAGWYLDGGRLVRNEYKI